MGSSAVAPPSSTANKSSEIEPSTICRENINRKPANTAAKLIGSDEMICVLARIIMANTVAPAINMTTEPYTHCSPAMIINPAMPGPVMRAVWPDTEVQAMALATCLCGTSKGTMACSAGVWKAREMPNNARMASITGKEMTPIRVSPKNAAAQRLSENTQTEMMRALEKRSAVMPASGNRIRNGAIWASPTSPRSRGLPVRL